MKMSISLSSIIIIGTIIASHSNAWRPLYNLYYTDVMASDLSYDCFYLAINQENNEQAFKVYRIQQIIEYCFRPSSKKQDNVTKTSTVASILNFDQLKKENITMENLIEWSSPIDLVERYENFLQMNKSSSIEKYYNCTVPWFGPFCQYKFALNQSFSDIVKRQFSSKLSYQNAPITCYIHMKCNRGPSPLCLDWREICDGKTDCLDGGEDEKDCFELEMNQCGENEFQCRNGMCVNEAFLMDGSNIGDSPECLDGSDESKVMSVDGCARDVSFKCEEVTCRSADFFSCGNGECVNLFLANFDPLCINQRDRIFSFKFGWNSTENARFPRCFMTLICASDVTVSVEFNNYCRSLCKNKNECKIQTLRLCSSSFIAPTFPVWGGHIRVGYFSNQTFTKISEINPQIICYDEHLCPFLIPTLIVDNYTCLHISMLNFPYKDIIYGTFLPCSRLYQSVNETHYPDPTMIRCLGMNKYIPKYQIMDGIPDCYGAFDESIAANSCALNDKYRFQCPSENKCAKLSIWRDNVDQCPGEKDDPIKIGIITNIKQLFFSVVCNNWIDMISLTNETDETDCDQWPCSNQYTRCNGAWNCPKGNDEMKCPLSVQCPVDYHPCFFPKNRTEGCLHVNYVEDGIVNCLGGTDERSYCRSKYPTVLNQRYRCWNDTKCIKAFQHCVGCSKFDNIDQLCQMTSGKIPNILLYLDSVNDVVFDTKPPFSHKSSHSFPPIQFQSQIDEHAQDEKIEVSQNKTNEKIDGRQAWLCSRGILILVGKNEMKQCLCPPSYYGNRCQYQNQRVSLTIRLRKQNYTKLDVIGIIITLIDHTGLVHSHEQITYIPASDCNTKFNLYLLYQNRPKNMTKNYTINIDAYDKVNLIYLTSWTLTVNLSFMPVNRVSAQLTIPAQHDCRLLCNHKYLESVRNVDIDSCRCSLNRSSTIRHECNCSPDSICVGFANHRSICLCPLKKVGPRCFINSICQVKTCANKGICVPDDARSSFINFVCVCPEGFFGRRCEKKGVKIKISFVDVEIPQSLLVHFIQVIQQYVTMENDKLMPPRMTMFKKISFQQDTITFYMPLPFHLMFAEIAKIYYLIVLQHNYTFSAAFSTQVTPSQRCPHIRELFDELTFSYTVLRRVKNYHVLCKKYSDLLCFHDNEVFMCLCTEERHANCFHFDFNMTYNCHGQNDCLNDAQCFQDHPQCPTTTMCVCPECFYGTKCQFSTKHFGLSLDTILGYNIYPQLSITKQSASVKTSIGLATLMLVIVLISGTLSSLTFQVKVCRQVGCGLYLFTSSIISIIIIIIFNLKLWFLILSLMGTITSHSFLLFNCITMEFLLRSLLAIIDWLHACVAVERVFTAFLGANFNKAKSKRTAKLLIVAIILLTTISLLHDPIYRELFDDIEEKRTWCLIRFTRSVNIYNTVINILHFITPFLLNLISAITIIVITAKQRSTAKVQHSFKKHLKEQFHHHKHLIFSSILLVILALPRLIISFLPTCMKSPREFKLFLTGYFISFIPHLLLFFIFVLTSKLYRKECNTLIRQKWKAFQRRLNLNSD